MIYFSFSDSCREQAEPWRKLLESCGAAPASDDARSLTHSDGLFLYLSGDDHTIVKDDLNMALNCRMPVAYVKEQDCVTDKGMEVQLGLASCIVAESAEEAIREWLGVCSRFAGKRRQKRLIAISALCAATACVALTAGIISNIVHERKERTAAPTAAASMIEQYLPEGTAPEKITELDLSGKGIEDLTFLRDAANLEVLNLADNDISDISPLAELTKLRKLDLSGNKVEDINPLLALKNLEELDICGNPVKDRSALDFMPGVAVTQ